jgi:hypothetical protein
MTLVRFGVSEPFTSENVTEMRFACATQDFDSAASVLIFALADGIFDVRPEAGPAAPTVKLHTGVIKRRIAGGAKIFPVRYKVVVKSAFRSSYTARLCMGLTKNLKLNSGQFFTKFRIAYIFVTRTNFNCC